MLFCSHRPPSELLEVLKPNLDRYFLTTGSPSPRLPYICKGGHLDVHTDEMLTSAFFHYALKASDLCASALVLCRASFCVPVMEQYSPVAIVIAINVRWNHPDVQH